MRFYTKDFKKSAIELSDQIGVKKAAIELGVSYASIKNWRNKREEICDIANTEIKSLKETYTVISDGKSKGALMQENMKLKAKLLKLQKETCTSLDEEIQKLEQECNTLQDTLDTLKNAINYFITAEQQDTLAK